MWFLLASWTWYVQLTNWGLKDIFSTAVSLLPGVLSNYKGVSEPHVVCRSGADSCHKINTSRIEPNAWTMSKWHFCCHHNFKHPYWNIPEKNDWLVDWVLSSRTEEGNICKQQVSCIPAHVSFTRPGRPACSQTGELNPAYLCGRREA